MAHTNSTTNYQLPQFIGTDKPGWLTDVNSAYLTIDTQMKTNADAASTNASAITTLQNTQTSLQNEVTTISSSFNENTWYKNANTTKFYEAPVSVNDETNFYILPEESNDQKIYYYFNNDLSEMYLSGRLYIERLNSLSDDTTFTVQINPTLPSGLTLPSSEIDLGDIFKVYEVLQFTYKNSDNEFLAFQTMVPLNASPSHAGYDAKSYFTTAGTIATTLVFPKTYTSSYTLSQNGVQALVLETHGVFPCVWQNNQIGFGA